MWVLTSGMYDSMVHAIFYSNMIAPIIGDRIEKGGLDYWHMCALKVTVYKLICKTQSSAVLNPSLISRKRLECFGS